MLIWCSNELLAMGPCVHRWRAWAIEELNEMISDVADQTDDWLASRPDHVAKAYTNPLNNMITQIPTLLTLMQLIQVPNMPAWSTELNQGFPVQGPMTPGPGWRNRTDDKLLEPWDEQAILAHNLEYAQSKARLSRFDPQWNDMLQEILKEQDSLRIEGPFQANQSLGFTTVGIENEPTAELRPMPHDQVLISGAFGNNFSYFKGLGPYCVPFRAQQAIIFFIQWHWAIRFVLKGTGP